MFRTIILPAALAALTAGASLPAAAALVPNSWTNGITQNAWTNGLTQNAWSNGVTGNSWSNGLTSHGKAANGDARRGPPRSPSSGALP